VKLAPQLAPQQASTRAKFLVLEVDLVLLSGEPVLEALLDSLAPGSQAVERAALRAGMHG
jgi:hypothetical protein